jgi:hypothetical protein
MAGLTPPSGDPAGRLAYTASVAALVDERDSLEVEAEFVGAEGRPSCWRRRAMP